MPKKLDDYITRWIDKNKTTAGYFAEALGIKSTQLVNYKRAKTDPPFSKICQMVDMGMSYEDLRKHFGGQK